MTERKRGQSGANQIMQDPTPWGVTPSTLLYWAPSVPTREQIARPRFINSIEDDGAPRRQIWPVMWVIRRRDAV